MHRRLATEADPVPIVNANTVLPLPAALQRLQSVAAKRAQIAQRPGGIQHAEFLKRLSVTLLKSPAAPGGEQPLCLAIPERLDHYDQYNARRYTRDAKGASRPFLSPLPGAGGLRDPAPALTRWATFWRPCGAGPLLYNGSSCLNSMWWAWGLTLPIRF